MVSFLRRLGLLLLDIIVFVLIFAAIAYSLTLLFNLVYDYPEEGKDIKYDPIFWLHSYTPLAFAAVGATWIVHSKIFRRPFKSTGLLFNNFLKDYSLGFVLGVLLISLGFLILRLLGYLDILEYHPILSTILLFFIFFIFQSFFEEVAFRSYLMPAIEERFGLWAALIISSVLFMAIHLSNNNIGIVGVSNIFLAGLLLGLIFIKYDNVWAASGFHCSWNYFQSTIFGFEVSGERMFSFIETEEVGPDLITGGAFGFEGSILSLVFLIVLILYYFTKDDFVKSRLRGDRNNINFEFENETV